jgi:hypothetical protein
MARGGGVDLSRVARVTLRLSELKTSVSCVGRAGAGGNYDSRGNRGNGLIPLCSDTGARNEPGFLGDDLGKHEPPAAAHQESRLVAPPWVPLGSDPAASAASAASFFPLGRFRHEPHASQGCKADPALSTVTAQSSFPPSRPRASVHSVETPGYGDRVSAQCPARTGSRTRAESCPRR